MDGMNRQIERHMERQVALRPDRRMERQMDKKVDPWTDRAIERRTKLNGPPQTF